MDTGSPVSNVYDLPFAFTGRIERVDIRIAPSKPSRSEEDELHESYLAFARHFE